MYIPNPLPFSAECFYSLLWWTSPSNALLHLLAATCNQIYFHKCTELQITVQPFLCSLLSPLFSIFKATFKHALLSLLSTHCQGPVQGFNVSDYGKKLNREILSQRKREKRKKPDKKKNWHWKNASPVQSIFRLAAETPLSTKGRGSLMTDVCAGLTQGWLKNKQL